MTRSFCLYFIGRCKICDEEEEGEGEGEDLQAEILLKIHGYYVCITEGQSEGGGLVGEK